MNHSTTSLHALWVPGIQHTDGDLAYLRREMADQVIIHPAGEHVSAQGKTFEQWIQETIQKELADVRKGAIDILIAHSFGAFRALEELQQCPELKAGILICPANNTPKEAPSSPTIPEPDKSNPSMTKTWNRSRPRTLMERLMWSTASDLDDEEFATVAARHDREQKSRPELRQLFSYLRNAPSFSTMLKNYKSQTPLLVIRSPCDPFVIENLQASELTTIIDLDSNIRHHPYISTPEIIAEIIRTWLQEIGILATEFQVPTCTDNEKPIVSTTSLVS